jgi:MraZ protein
MKREKIGLFHFIYIPCQHASQAFSIGITSEWILSKGIWFVTLRKKMFFGKYSLPLGEENQLTLPSNYREAMSNVAYITRGFDRNLILLTQQAFTAVCSQIKATSISDPLARLLSRLFLGGAVEITIDGSGKIILPFSLCEYAELSKELILVGQGEYLELWSPALWQKQMENMNDCDLNTLRFEKFHVSLA